MSYTKTVWEDLPSTNTPITAENLNNMEDGIETNDRKLSGEEVIGNIVVDSIRTKNMFDKTTYFQGFIDTSNSNIAFDIPPQDRYCGIAKVKPNTTYTISKQAGYSFRIATTTSYPTSGTSYNTTQANHTGTSITLTTGANDNYIVVFYYATSNGDTGGQEAMASTIQVEEGSTATEYSAYQNLDRTLDNYSTSEQRIGTWIDGKPIYRKVIKVTSIDSANNNYDIPISISNLNEIVNIGGTIKITGTNTYKPITVVYTDNSNAIGSHYSFSVYAITNSYISLSYGSWWKTTFDKAYIILEYTKTTD